LPANAKPRTFLVKRARAERILSMRAAGATQEQVARALDCCVETIRRTERWAEQNGMLEAAQDRFLRMLNKSANVYEKRLDDDANNPKLALDAARDVAFGTGVLRKQHNQNANPDVEEESLTLILKRRREKLAANATDAESGHTEGSGDVIEGELAEEPAPEGLNGAVRRFFGATADGAELAQDDESS
jgi:hypothetical protein